MRSSSFPLLSWTEGVRLLYLFLIIAFLSIYESLVSKIYSLYLFEIMNDNSCPGDLKCLKWQRPLIPKLSFEI